MAAYLEAGQEARFN